MFLRFWSGSPTNHGWLVTDKGLEVDWKHDRLLPKELDDIGSDPETSDDDEDGYIALDDDSDLIEIERDDVSDSDENSYDDDSDREVDWSHLS